VIANDVNRLVEFKYQSLHLTGCRPVIADRSAKRLITCCALTVGFTRTSLFEMLGIARQRKQLELHGNEPTTPGKHHAALESFDQGDTTYNSVNDMALQRIRDAAGVSLILIYPTSICRA
jgi:hypothetical protein